MADITIECLRIDDFDRHLLELADVLHACVHQGASVSFIMPFGKDDACAFWQEGVREGVVSKRRTLIVAKIERKIAGTVQLDCDTPPNQAHRADVSKLLVHPDFRRRGVARALMIELERQATLRLRQLLTLDTRTGDDAEPLYASLGYQTVGTIPNFAKDPHTNKLDGTTYMYKQL